MLKAKSDQGDEVSIMHLIIEGSCQWVNGRNLTTKCNIFRIGKNVLQLPDNAGTISVQNFDLHCYVPCEVFSDRFDGASATIFCATAKLENSAEFRPWQKVK